MDLFKGVLISPAFPGHERGSSVSHGGGRCVSMYAVLGEHDLVFTLDFPDAEKALATSVALNKMTGISFTTSPVVEVEKFDRLMTEARKI